MIRSTFVYSCIDPIDQGTYMYLNSWQEIRELETRLFKLSIYNSGINTYNYN